MVDAKPFVQYLTSRCKQAVVGVGRSNFQRGRALLCEFSNVDSTQKKPLFIKPWYVEWSMEDKHIPELPSIKMRFSPAGGV